jgi:antitoxin component YwqK of YwqJK toxin-antitoxin module
MKTLFLLIALNFFPVSGTKTYSKIYFENGNLKSEGWLYENQKIDYWFYYYENGNKKEEGHYDRNKKIKWWIFYDLNGNIQRKAEFKNNMQEGLCLVYKNGALIKAEEYKNGIKTKEWTTLSKFKRDHP